MVPRSGRGEDRIPQDVTDISASSQLLRYALAGQLDRLDKLRPDLSQTKIAIAAGLAKDARSAASVLSHALRGGFSPAQLTKLDDVISSVGGLAPGQPSLSSLHTQLAGGRPSTIAIARVPANWLGSEGRQTHSELEVLAEASALLTAFVTAGRVDVRSVSAIAHGYGYVRLNQLVQRLTLMSASSPTSRTQDAQIILGALASYTFDAASAWLDAAVRHSPLGFRVWPAISALTRFMGSGAGANQMRDWLEDLIRSAGQLRLRSLYPGQGLDLELALAVPFQWSPPADDWVDDALQARASDNNASLCERGTAVAGLWQRAVEAGRSDEAEPKLRRLIAAFRDPMTGPDVAAGLRWIAATLETAMEQLLPVCNEWPDIDEPWFRNVQRAADELDTFAVPRHLRQGTKNLFLHMILQNAGSYRRHAIETIVASGMTNPVGRALGRLLASETDEAWLRIRAEFALGSLQRANRHVEDDLTRACLAAYRNLRLPDVTKGQQSPRSRVAEVHASLFAVADCFGVPGVEDRARSAREQLRPILTELAEVGDPHAPVLCQAARAAAYLLTVTAQPQDGAEPDLSQVLLAKLRHHPDEVTARLAKWALSFRFAADGSVRPMLDAAETV